MWMKGQFYLILTMMFLVSCMEDCKLDKLGELDRLFGYSDELGSESTLTFIDSIGQDTLRFKCADISYPVYEWYNDIQKTCTLKKGKRIHFLDFDSISLELNIFGPTDATLHLAKPYTGWFLMGDSISHHPRISAQRIVLDTIIHDLEFKNVILSTTAIAMIHKELGIIYFRDTNGKAWALLNREN